MLIYLNNDVMNEYDFTQAKSPVPLLIVGLDLKLADFHHVFRFFRLIFSMLVLLPHSPSSAPLERVASKWSSRVVSRRVLSCRYKRRHVPNVQRESEEHARSTVLVVLSRRLKTQVQHFKKSS